MSKIDLKLIDCVESLLVGKSNKEKERIRKWITIYKITSHIVNKKNTNLGIYEIKEEQRKQQNYLLILTSYTKYKNIDHVLKLNDERDYYA